MPRMVFPAPCSACGDEERKFIEFKAEPCTPGGEVEARYGFRCMVCKTIVEEVRDSGGVRHAWEAGQHIEA